MLEGRETSFVGQVKGTGCANGGSSVASRGDFNIFLSEDERQGSNKKRTREIADFANAISDCQLLNLEADGAQFTWARGSTFEKLDRVLIGEGWSDLFAATRVTNLPRVMSDHGPLIIQCQLPGPPIRPSFRFQNMWVRHHTFLREVEESWLEPTGERGMVNLQLKLGRVKKRLRWWNKNVFGNIFERVKQADLEAQKAHKNYELNQSPVFRSEMNRTAAELVLKLKMEEDLWKQKAAVRWTVEGERNTKFFQGWVKQKRAKSRFMLLKKMEES